jgi:hypothetical protein
MDADIQLADAPAKAFSAAAWVDAAATHGFDPHLIIQEDGRRGLYMNHEGADMRFDWSFGTRDGAEDRRRLGAVLDVLRERGLVYDLT